jgi:hypothetical protein
LWQTKGRHQQRAGAQYKCLILLARQPLDGRRKKEVEDVPAKPAQKGLVGLFKSGELAE